MANFPSQPYCTLRIATLHDYKSAFSTGFVDQPFLEVIASLIAAISCHRSNKAIVPLILFVVVVSAYAGKLATGFPAVTRRLPEEVIHEIRRSIHSAVEMECCFNLHYHFIVRL